MGTAAPRGKGHRRPSNRLFSCPRLSQSGPTCFEAGRADQIRNRLGRNSSSSVTVFPYKPAPLRSSVITVDPRVSRSFPDTRMRFSLVGTGTGPSKTGTGPSKNRTELIRMGPVWADRWAVWCFSEPRNEEALLVCEHSHTRVGFSPKSISYLVS